MPDLARAASGLSDGIVTLRQWVRSDARFISEACSDKGIRRYNAVPIPYSIVEAEHTIEEFTSRWHAFGTTGNPSGVAFGVINSKSDEPVGLCGIDDWSALDVAQIGYWIAADARGSGYATRAVRLVTRWLFELGAARVFMTIASDNSQSAAVARRAGFVYEGTMRSAGVIQDERCDVMWFAALPREWDDKSMDSPDT